MSPPTLVSSPMYCIKAASSDAHVFIVDPNAQDVVKNFAGYEEYATFFHNINLEFGKKGYAHEFFQAVEPYLSSLSY